ncbi:MAG: M42 family metallopeptidase [Promethearchaeota archaeon]
MFDELEKLLARLVEVPAPFGYEDRLIGVVRDELKPYVDDMKIDTMGNIIGTKKGTSDKAPRVMVAAHMDECGFVVKCIEPSGYLRFFNLGYLGENIMHAQRVVVTTEKGSYYGVIGVKSFHITPADKWRAVQPQDQMYIDVGAKSKEEAEEMGIKPGSIVTFDRSLTRLGKGEIVAGKALDDRIGLLIMIETMKRLAKLKHKATVHPVATVQEEAGLRGAKVATYTLNPDMAIVLEITVSGDTPDTEFREAPVIIGNGPAIKVMDLIPSIGQGTIAHPAVRDWLVDTAETQKIPFQLEVMPGVSTDAAIIHQTRSGVPTCVLSVPTRYTHSPVETLSLNDTENAIRLLTAALQNLDDDFSLSRI